MDNDQITPPFNSPGASGLTGAQTPVRSTPQISPDDEDEGLALGEIIAVSSTTVG